MVSLNIILIYFVILINCVYSQNSCTSIIPKHIDNCTQYTTPNSICCFVEDPNNSFFNYCRELDIGSYLTSDNYTSLSGTNLRMRCGVSYAENGWKTCGSSSPTWINDCTKYSTIDNSCCYYNNYGSKGCVLHKYKTEGSIVLGNVILQCSSIFLEISYLIVFVYILLY
jgi:hypothetical protein